MVGYTGLYAVISGNPPEWCCYKAERRLQMILVTCPSCKKVHQIYESLLGKRVQCKDCGVAFEARSNGAQPVPAAVAGSKGAEILDEPVEVPRDVPSKAQRPFGLVWVVFYWIINGLLAIPLGYIIACMGSALGGTNEMTRNMFGSRGFGESGGTPALAAAFLEFIGLLVFHFGLILLVACYGLWTYRKWGLSLARGLAVASFALNVLIFILGIISRAGIVAGLIGMVISAGILVYLYGYADLRERLKGYIPTGGLQGGSWEQYK